MTLELQNKMFPKSSPRNYRNSTKPTQIPEVPESDLHLSQVPEPLFVFPESNDLEAPLGGVGMGAGMVGGGR